MELHQPARPAACSSSGSGSAPPSTWSAAATPPCAATSSPRSARIDAARRAVTGTGYDGVLLIPSFFEAGRFTAGDIHWAIVDGGPVPAGASEFARDATFGYTSSDLRDFVAEKSGGTITADQVHSITLEDIRRGGPQRVAEILAGVAGGAFVVVNATDYADLEIVVLGLLDAEEQGRSFLYRTGPSFPRPLAGLEPQKRSRRRRSGPPATRAATGSWWWAPTSG